MCPNCLLNQEEEDGKYYERGEVLRLEAIKEQILTKLGLSARPNVSGALPRDLILQTLTRAHEGPPLKSPPTEPVDDYYATTSEIVTFAEPGNQCKARWSNIRDNFRKSLGKRRTKSGQAAKKSKPYRFENQLQFLLQFIEERETKGNVGLHPESENVELNSCNEQEIPRTTNIPSPPQSTNQSTSPPFEQQNPTNSTDIPSTSTASFARPTPMSGRKKIPQPETAASTLLKYVLDKNENKKNTPTVTLDNPIDCFLFGISSTLKSLPPYLLHSAKSEIFSTVQKFEFEMLQNKRVGCSVGQPVQQTPYDAASLQIQPIDDTSSPGSVGSVKEYWENFDGQQN